MENDDEVGSPLRAVGRRSFMKTAGAAALLAAVEAPFSPTASARPSDDRILIRGGVVLTFDSAIGDFERADVLIEGNKIGSSRFSVGKKCGFS